MPLGIRLRGPVEACLPFAGELPSADDLIVRTEPAHREAFIGASGEAMAGSPREVYFTDDEVEPDQPFCDIAFPIR